MVELFFVPITQSIRFFDKVFHEQKWKNIDKCIVVKHHDSAPRIKHVFRVDRQANSLHIVEKADETKLHIVCSLGNVVPMDIGHEPHARRLKHNDEEKRTVAISKVKAGRNRQVWAYDSNLTR